MDGFSGWFCWMVLLDSFDVWFCWMALQDSFAGWFFSMVFLDGFSGWFFWMVLLDGFVGWFFWMVLLDGFVGWFCCMVCWMVSVGCILGVPHGVLLGAGGGPGLILHWGSCQVRSPYQEQMSNILLNTCADCIKECTNTSLRIFPRGGGGGWCYLICSLQSQRSKKPGRFIMEKNK